MKILMYGWEFPPHKTGGLGTACYGLTKGLAKQGVEITFVVPFDPKDEKSHVRLRSSEEKRLSKKILIPSGITTPYMLSSGESYNFQNLRVVNGKKSLQLYGKDLYDAVERYAILASQAALDEEHDVIHAHDWLTFKAGVLAKKLSGKPLVVHVHATEYDRTGGNGINEYVYSIEKEGMDAADMVVAVSNFTKNMVMQKYGIPEEKIQVVHNGVTEDEYAQAAYASHNPFEGKKVVLFLGRVTLQKGPDYFIEAAARVARHDPNAVFVIAGEGNMLPGMINRAADLGIADRVFFTGFLTGRTVDEAYRMASVYVMPSVSEPFGITALEAARNNVPVIISKQSGASEVMNHVMKVDFWDTDKLANNIIGVLKYSDLSDTLRQNSSVEIRKLNWDNSASKVKGIYESVLARRIGA